LSFVSTTLKMLDHRGGIMWFQEYYNRKKVELEGVFGI